MSSGPKTSTETRASHAAVAGLQRVRGTQSNKSIATVGRSTPGTPGKPLKSTPEPLRVVEGEVDSPDARAPVTAWGSSSPGSGLNVSDRSPKEAEKSSVVSPVGAGDKQTSPVYRKPGVSGSRGTAAPSRGLQSRGEMRPLTPSGLDAPDTHRRLSPLRQASPSPQISALNGKAGNYIVPGLAKDSPRIVAPITSGAGVKLPPSVAELKKTTAVLESPEVRPRRCCFGVVSLRPITIPRP